MKRITLSLPAGLLASLDAYCEANHYERSELIRHLIRLKVDFVLDRGHLQDRGGVNGSAKESKKLYNVAGKLFRKFDDGSVEVYDDEKEIWVSHLGDLNS